ncbi:hypothetical protein CfE428DRAFT_1030 [Chthoniobacter flavus Ellin428]|uniref:Uncharacterized protein n=1 Tax=Chthoniobacter flavus Ellin428 TaxID=497964 RepID=B4CWJ2_9BACT|nr:hypothetical protein [Chthoniobacter flavus]EDY21784.1 hypothetical protein CfE428DRAFT_1030 [Chthoniobacter flavus Ellin428]TCO95714.1 hypothetical protein EV701_101405 [Chthoniobacter flavus]
MTIVEMIVATCVFTAAMAALISASIAMQTSFKATDSYFSSQGDQLRVMDYFNTDLRRAMAVSVSSNSVTYTPPGGSTQTFTYTNNSIGQATKYFTVVIPHYRKATTPASAFYDPTTLNDVTIVNNKVAYGTDYSKPIVVCYYLLGSTLYRAEVDPDLPATDSRNNPRSIADNVSDFSVIDKPFQAPLTTQIFITVSATFAPKFSRSNWMAALQPNSNTDARVGTTVGTKVLLRNIF